MMVLDTGARADKLYIFRPRNERVYFVLLATALLLVIAIALDLLTVPVGRPRWMKFAIFFLCFNYLHTLLTLLGLIVLPEMRAWLKTQFKPKRAAVFVTITGFIVIIGFFLRDLHRDEMNEALLLAVFLVLLSVLSCPGTPRSKCAGV